MSILLSNYHTPFWMYANITCETIRDQHRCSLLLNYSSLSIARYAGIYRHAAGPCGETLTFGYIDILWLKHIMRNSQELFWKIYVICPCQLR